MSQAKKAKKAEQVDQAGLRAIAAAERQTISSKNRWQIAPRSAIAAQNQPTVSVGTDFVGGSEPSIIPTRSARKRRRLHIKREFDLEGATSSVTKHAS